MRVVRSACDRADVDVSGYACLAWLAWSGIAIAGPPFVTDDPVPTDLGHWEIYNFVSASHVPGDTGGQAGLDLNYGGAKDLQLTAVIPLGYDAAKDIHVGVSNVELAVKYRLVHQRDDTAIPDFAVFPRIIVATGGARFVTGHTNVLLPIWAGKDFGKWSVFGGGGYDINPGTGQRNFWLMGAGLTRAVTKRLALGAEVYRRTADSADGAAFTGVNLGLLYSLTAHWSLIAASGPGLQNARREGQYDVYAALKADY